MKNLKFEFILLVSFMINVILIFYLVFHFSHHNQEQRKISNEKLNVYREIVANQFFILHQLNTIIEDNNIDNIADGIALAQNTSYINLRLHNKVEMPIELQTFHYSLNAYLFQYQKVILNDKHSEHINDIKWLAQVLEEYRNVLDYSYYDSEELMKKKITNATENVIVPFWKSKDNPL